MSQRRKAPLSLTGSFLAVTIALAVGGFLFFLLIVDDQTANKAGARANRKANAGIAGDRANSGAARRANRRAAQGALLTVIHASATSKRKRENGAADFRSRFHNSVSRSGQLQGYVSIAQVTRPSSAVIVCASAPLEAAQDAKAAAAASRVTEPFGGRQ